MDLIDDRIVPVHLRLLVESAFAKRGCRRNRDRRQARAAVEGGLRTHGGRRARAWRCVARAREGTRRTREGEVVAASGPAAGQRFTAYPSMTFSVPHPSCEGGTQPPPPTSATAVGNGAVSSNAPAAGAGHTVDAAEHAALHGSAAPFMGQVWSHSASAAMPPIARPPKTVVSYILAALTQGRPLGVQRFADECAGIDCAPPTQLEWSRLLSAEAAVAVDVTTVETVNQTELLQTFRPAAQKPAGERTSVEKATLGA
jgi:hypothetical protein